MRQPAPSSLGTLLLFSAALSFVPPEARADSLDPAYLEAIQAIEAAPVKEFGSAEPKVLDALTRSIAASPKEPMPFVLRAVLTSQTADCAALSSRMATDPLATCCRLLKAVAARTSKAPPRSAEKCASAREWGGQKRTMALVRSRLSDMEHDLSDYVDAKRDFKEMNSFFGRRKVTATFGERLGSGPQWPLEVDPVFATIPSDAPGWIESGSGAFREETARRFVGVSIVDSNPPHLAGGWEDRTAACALFGLVKVQQLIETYVAALAKPHPQKGGLVLATLGDVKAETKTAEAKPSDAALTSAPSRDFKDVKMGTPPFTLMYLSKHFEETSAKESKGALKVTEATKLTLPPNSEFGAQFKLYREFLNDGSTPALAQTDPGPLHFDAAKLGRLMDYLATSGIRVANVHVSGRAIYCESRLSLEAWYKGSAPAVDPVFDELAAKQSQLRREEAPTAKD